MMFKKIYQWFVLFDFRHTRVVFYQDLSEMYRRGEAMLSFLEGELFNSIKTKQRSRAAALKMLLSRYESGQDGGRMEQLLRGIVPQSDAMMLTGVERSANKSESLLSLSQAVAHQNEMKKVMWMYSIMPLVILPICISLIVIMSGVIQEIDKGTPIYVRDQVWSGFNWLAKLVADIAYGYGLILLAIGAGLLGASVWSLPRWTGRSRLKADQFPLYSLYRDFQAGLLFSSMAMLLRTGGSLRGTLEDLAQRSSRVTRWHLIRVLQSLDDAPNMSVEAFGRGILSPYLLARAMTLQRTCTSFSDVLIELGTSEGARVLARVKRAAIIANVAVVGTLGTIAAILGMASITVPGTFAAVMEPTNMMVSKRTYDLNHPEVSLTPIRSNSDR